MMIDRGIGTTTSQIVKAPKDAWYITTNEIQVKYVRDLAHRLCRDDLTAITLSEFIHRKVWRGSIKPIEVDHAVRPTNHEADVLDYVEGLWRLT